MDKELKTLRALIPKHEERERFLEKALEQCRKDWQLSSKAPPEPEAGPPPPPPPPKIVAVSLPSNPLGGLEKSLADVKLRTAEIEPAAKRGAETSENTLLSQIEQFAKGKLKRASVQENKKRDEEPKGGLMGELFGKMKDRRKAIADDDEETPEEKAERDAEFELDNSLIMDVIQGRYFRERVKAIIGDRFFV